MSEKRDKRMLKPGVIAAEGVEESGGIDQGLLEKRLEGLRDTQESVQGLSLWCQANKRHSSAIIETWLKILKKSPVEKRLTLFYLANDVVQHAKRKNDPAVVNQWAFAVQKATPQVRTPSSVSSAIVRIFKIWEERGVYSKETIADLLALLNNVPAKERAAENKKPETYTASADKVAAFHSSHLISKIKLAYRLKSHLGVTFRAKPFVHMDIETLKGSIKDRAHGMEVIQEIGQLVEQLRTSENKLTNEVEERRKIVETAEIAIVHFENVRGEAKIVNSAYKNFTERVEATRDKVIEKCKSFEEMEIDSSPVPSPPREAPSPPPDDDDFGIRPADSIGSSTWNKSSTSAAIRNDIMDALKTTVSGQSQASTNTFPSSQAAAVDTSKPPPTNNSMHAPTYDQLAAIQQLQQTWGQNQDFAAMSAMLQHMIPGTGNYAPVHQTSAYGNHQSGYDAYQGQSNSGVPDISSIPLPPPPPISKADPLLESGPKEIPQSHMPVPPLMSPPISQNPYLSGYSYEGPAPPLSTDNGSEYVPLPYYKPSEDLNSSYGGDYNYGGSTASTPTPNLAQNHNQFSHQPYNSRRTSDTSVNSLHDSVSPSYSNHSRTSMNENRHYATSSNSSTQQFDPMEMFQSALTKNKSNNITSSGYPPQGPDGLGGATANNHGYSQPHAEVSPNPFYNPNSSSNPYENFDEHNANMNGGDGVEPYTPRKPGMDNFFSSRGPSRGTPRSLFHNNSGPGRIPRGRGLGKGGIPSSRGFGGHGGGFRGRGGPPRGSPRGIPRFPSV